MENKKGSDDAAPKNGSDDSPFYCRLPVPDSRSVTVNEYDEKPRFSCSGSGRIEKKFHLRQLTALMSGGHDD